VATLGRLPEQEDAQRRRALRDQVLTDEKLAEIGDPPKPHDVAHDDSSEGFLDLLELQAAEWAGRRPINELLAAIERAGAKRFAGKVRAALGS
jgi:hypothetical protein